MVDHLVLDLRIVDAVNAGELTFEIVDHWASRLAFRIENARRKKRLT